MQLNAICRLAKLMGNNEKITMISTLVYSNFKCSLLVWHVLGCSCEPLQKTEKIQKRCLSLVLDDYESNYGNERRMVPPQSKFRD